MRRRSSPFLIHLTLLSCLAFAGCGGGDRPPLGCVTGTVTLDGEPLVGVIVTFKPEIGRPAVGTTDAVGKYRLEYTRGVQGTKVGENVVGFTWPIGVAGKPIPARYAVKSDLTCAVKSGRNTFDFDLESDPEDDKQKKAAPQFLE